MVDQFTRGSEEEEGAGRRERGGMEKSLVRKDEVAPPLADLEERDVLEEKLCWTRLELQRTLAVSADADETICKLATVAQRMMRERDEARNHQNTLLAEIQAMNGQAMLLTGRRHPRIATSPGHAFARFAANGYTRGRAPAAATPYSGMTLKTQLGQYAQAPGASYCFSSSSSRGGGGGLAAGHCRSLAPWLSIGGTVAADPAGFHDWASSSQDSFDPNMFLVDATAESPQGRVPARTAVPRPAAPGKSCGNLGLVAGQMLLPPRKRKKVKRAPARDHDAGPSATMQPVADGGSIKVRGAGWSLADVVNSAGSSCTSC